MIKFIQSLHEVSIDDWRNLLTENDPFLDYYYLSGLEKYCNLDRQGWTPAHIACFQDNRLAGLMPLYLKTDSYGEFVFDWAWADAYEKTGRHYYPKLVSAIPFSPVTGKRLLINKNIINKEEISKSLTNAALDFINDNHLSGMHCLFHHKDTFKYPGEIPLLTRTGCQYHWFNDGYNDFDTFLDRLNSKRRKQIRKERKDVRQQGVEIEVLHGDQISDQQWEIFHQFYSSTFFRKWGNPRLTLDFFKSLTQNMPDSTLLFLAKLDGKYVAGAFAMKNENTLYGRHWGCCQSVRHLHFELCYYQTIEYCINHGLTRLDAGAQGEHKIYRGFIPVKTWSSHWIREDWFYRAIKDFIIRESDYIDDYIENLQTHLSYKPTINQC